MPLRTTRTIHMAFTALALFGVLGSGCSDGDDPDTGIRRGSGASGGSIAVTGGTTGKGGTVGSGGAIGVGGASSGGNSSGGTTSGGTSSGGTGGGCTGTSAVGMMGDPAVVLLLVDTSLSMDQTAMGDNQTKLEATKDALEETIAELPAGLNIGLMFYPGTSETGLDNPACFNDATAVPIAPLTNQQRTSLTQAVNGVDAGGSTPTHDGYQYAIQQISASAAAGQKFVVLITDGTPTYALGCLGTGMPDQPVDTAPLIAEAGTAYAAGIKTFVVGSPGSDDPDARPSLSAMARAGGTAPMSGCNDQGGPYCHFDMTQTSDVSGALQMALGAIVQQIPVNCNFEIPPNPSGETIDTTRVNVAYTVNGMANEAGKDPDGQCNTDGWIFDDENNPTQVILCPQLCDRIQMDAQASVNIEFGCETRVLEPVT